jgi:glycosyltransferase involved in cell wall biosynthesis
LSQEKGQQVPCAADGERPCLTVIVPVFNEKENIGDLHDRMARTLDEYGKSYELLFIDDGSTDGSYEMLQALHGRDPNVRAVRFLRNFGQQMAVAAGFEYARGDVVVLIDADLQAMPEEIPLLVDKLGEGFDIVYGVRQRRQDPLVRRIGSWCMSHLLYRVTGIGIPDAATAFIALDRKFVDSIRLYNERSRYFSGLFAWLSYGRSGSVDVTHAPRQAGATKYNIRKLVGLTLNFVCSFSVLPLRFAAYLGAALIAAGGMALAVLLGIRLLDSGAPALGTWVLAALMAFLAGVQLFAVGVLGEYLARVYTEVKDRPSYVVRDVLDHGDGAHLE